MDKIDQLLTRGVERIYPKRQALEKRLRSKKKIRLYLGIDPTGTKLHLGHTIPLRKLQQFAQLGHETILLFGTGTVLVGDPSQRARARNPITESEIKQNIATWKEQVGKIIDFKKVKIKQNADWLLKLKLKDIINIASKISAVQLFKRDMFQERLKRRDTIWAHETLYPLLQGYDSVVMDVDLEIGGNDQTFNMLTGRELIKKMKNKEKFVLTTPMILGTDGKQMSKTSQNCIWLTDSPAEMFGKLMSIPDNLILPYFELLTNLSIQRYGNLVKTDPMEAKKQLAHAIVTIYHSKNEADKTQQEFERVIQKKALPSKIPVLTIKKRKTMNIIELLVKSNLCRSRGEAKRLIKQNGVKINQQTVNSVRFAVGLKNDIIIQVGKRRFLKIRIN